MAAGVWPPGATDAVRVQGTHLIPLSPGASTAITELQFGGAPEAAPPPPSGHGRAGTTSVPRASVPLMPVPPVRHPPPLLVRQRRLPPGAGLSLVLDRTSLSLVGAGAWAAAIAGGRGQRGWRTRHRGGDRSGVILVHPLPVRCPPCGRRRAPRSPPSGPIPGERDRFRPLERFSDSPSSD